MATVVLLLTYLPAALHFWSPGYKKKDLSKKGTESKLAKLVGEFWRQVGEVVIRYHRWVTIGTVVIYAGYEALTAALGYPDLALQAIEQTLELRPDDQRAQRVKQAIYQTLESLQ